MLKVKGSLKKHSEWWHLNIKNPYILGVIDEGYKLPLIEIPEPIILKNNKSALENASFVDEELTRLLISGVVVECIQPTVINALSVATNASGKHRLVLDLRMVNPLLCVPHVKYEDIKTASLYFKLDNYMAVFDLKSGYHHIDIHKAYQQYTGSSWRQKHYYYSTCPFGMATAGAIFSNVLRELVKLWRAQGIAVVMYLDDGIILGDNIMDTMQATQKIRRDLLQSGFIVNEEKSNWSPSKEITWLGFNLNAQQNTFRVPTEKLTRLKVHIRGNLVYQHQCSARKLAKQ
jgi:hypothetical protein